MHRLMLRAPRRAFGGSKGLPDLEPDNYVNEAGIMQHNNLDRNIRKTVIKSLYDLFAVGPNKGFARQAS